MNLRRRFLRGILLVALPPAVVAVPVFGALLRSAEERSAAFDLRERLGRSARNLEGALDDAIDRVLRLAADPEVARLCVAVSEETALLAREALRARLEEGERAWTSPGSALEAQILALPLSERLREETQGEGRELAEVFLTDRSGALIAASGRTSDYDQSDEAWWRRAWNGGSGALYVGEILFDESAGVTSIETAVPVRAPEGRVAGILKGVLDVRRILRRSGDVPGGTGQGVALFSRTGARVHAGDPAAPWRADLLRRILSGGSGTARFDSSEDGQAYAAAYRPIRLSDRQGERRAGEETYFLAAYQPRSFSRSPWIWAALLALVEAFLIALVGGAAWWIAGTLERDLRGFERSVSAATADGEARALAPRTADLAPLARALEDLRERTRASVERTERRAETLREALDRETSALASARSRLEENEERREDFLRTVSHEIRTPLTAIRSFVEILSRYEEDPAMRAEFLRILEVESTRLNELLDDLLEWSRVGGAAGLGFRERVSLADALAAARDELGPEAHERRFETIFEIPPDLPEVLANPVLLSRVFRTLAGAAGRVTSPGERIAVRAWARSGELFCTISMGGKGVPREERERIFQAFGLDPDSPSDLPKGSGLGLPLCRKILERMGGGIEVVDEFGAACAFRVTLKAASPGGPRPSAPTRERAPFAGAA